MTISSSDLEPIDYVCIFTAIRDHGGLTQVTVANVHRYCPSSKVGVEFHYNSQSPKGPIQLKLSQYLKNENGTTQLMANWLCMFRDSGG